MNTNIKKTIITLYYNRIRECPQNSQYPIKKTVTCEDDLQEIAAYDHVCAKYKDNYRRNDNFIEANVSMFDIDNAETDDKNEWVYPKQIAESFPDVMFYIIYSRNHMKEKNGKEPRPKFHVYFPHSLISNKEEYKDLKNKVCDFFPKFDQNAKDIARFFFGVKNPKVEYHDGSILLSDFIKNIYTKTNVCASISSKNTDVIQEGYRNTTLSKFAARVLTRWGDKSEKAYSLYIEESKKCCPMLDTKEIHSIWNSALKFYRQKVVTRSDYILPESFSIPRNLLKPSNFTDLDQAHIFYQEYGNITAYSVATGYLYFNGKVWLESEPKVHGLVQELTERQLEEAVSELKKAQYYAYQPTLQEDYNSKIAYKDKVEYTKKYRTYVLGRRNTMKISAVLREIQPMIDIDVALLDSNGFLLNTPDGEVDLYTGRIKEHNPKDYCTTITKVGPSETGRELFEDFLEQITCGDKELQDYLQLISGMGAVGKVFNENLILAYGNGKNGKSTFFNLISKVMGDYAGHLSSETLLSHSTKNKSPEYAELRGKRIVTVSELDEDKFLDTAIMKKLCSTDEIIAEKKYKAPFSFSPTHTLILCTNHLPRVNMSDHGTWRRLLVIPFKGVVSEEKEIKNYADYLFDYSGGAVMSWIIEGAKKFLEVEGKISIPEAVRNATENYRAENDWLNNFLSERCELGENFKVLAKDLYDGYKKYCEETGEEIKSNQAFGRALSNAGFERSRTSSCRSWKGLRILDVSTYTLPDYSVTDNDSFMSDIDTTKVAF